VRHHREVAHDAVRADPGHSDSLVRCRDRFRAVPIHRDASMPLIGVVGEIFLPAEHLLQRRPGAAAGGVRRRGLAQRHHRVGLVHERRDFSQAEVARAPPVEGRRDRLDPPAVQHRDEHVLREPFGEEFIGCEEPGIYEVLECARPYLPQDGALGEMVLNVGKAIYLAKKGADGIIDISPFTCMNGIVSEAVYRRSAATWAASPSATSTSTARSPTWTATWASTSSSPATTSAARSSGGGRFHAKTQSRQEPHCFLCVFARPAAGASGELPSPCGTPA